MKGLTLSLHTCTESGASLLGLLLGIPPAEAGPGATVAGPRHVQAQIGEAGLSLAFSPFLHQRHTVSLLPPHSRGQPQGSLRRPGTVWAPGRTRPGLQQTPGTSALVTTRQLPGTWVKAAPGHMMGVDRMGPGQPLSSPQPGILVQ